MLGLLACGLLLVPGSAGAAAATAAAAAAGGSVLDLPAIWDQDDGTRVRLDHWVGHPIVITMDCSDTCSYTMFRLTQLARAAAARGLGIDIVVVTYNPVVDDARAWARFRRNRGLTDPHWHFLSGSDEATRALADLLGFRYWFMDEHVLHEFAISLLDSEGRVVRSLSWATRNEDLLAALVPACTSRDSSACAP